MKKRLTILAALIVCSLTGIIPLSVSTSLAQAPRHVYLEEFTGTWCGYCVRGTSAIETIEQKYPGMAIPVSIHNADPMENAQGDSLQAGVQQNPTYASSVITGFPSAWTSRHAWPATGGGVVWSTDPAYWVDTLPGFDILGQQGLAEQLMGPATQATISMDNLTFDPSTRMVSVRVTANFLQAMSGDFRMNVVISEDSLTGPAGTTWMQHNYYYHCPNIPGNSSDNPYWDQGDPNYQPQPCGAYISDVYYMNVFRGCATSVWGATGIIPYGVDAGSSYTQTFSFPLPQDVTDPNHVHIIGIVHQYSGTDPSGNEVFDAATLPLTTTPVKVVPDNLAIQLNDGQYLYAHANGDTTTTMIIQNAGDNDVTVNLSQDALAALPAGWSMKFSSPVVVVPGGGAVMDSVTFTAPEQSDYTVAGINMLPTQQGAFVVAPPEQYYVLLSDNTHYGEYYDASTGAEAAAYRYNAGMVDSLSLHTALIPLNNSTMLYYDPMNLTVAMFPNNVLLDNNGSYANTSIMQSVNDMLAAGKKIYISSNTDLFYALAGNATTETPNVQGFLFDTLGMNLRTVTSRINAAQTAYVTFPVTGTSDPIGAGMTLTGNSAGAYQADAQTATFSLPSGSHSVPLFYTDNSASNNIALKYESTTGARLVLLGFTLNSLGDQVSADSIFNHSIQWLLGSKNPENGVPVQQATNSDGMTAMPNPFHGVTQVQYTAAPGERDVTISAFDLLGREVAKLPVQNADGSTYTSTFNANDLANGTYVIVVHSSTGTHNLRVVNQQ